MTVQKFQIIRECLETTYSHVTFIKSSATWNDGLVESIATAWKVGTLEIPFIVVYDVDYTVTVTSEISKESDGLKMSDLIALKLFKGENKKIENEKVENKVVELKVLKNGVRVLENGIKNDFELAQNILNRNNTSRDIDAEYAYVERDYTHYEGTYNVSVERRNDYLEFAQMLNNQKCVSKRDDDSEYIELRQNWLIDAITRDEYRKGLEAVDERLKNCKCTACEIQIPNFEEWKNGVIEITEFNEYLKADKIKSLKIGKYLTKNKISQEVIDFYSAQVKTEKATFITITSAPQFIAGMSYFAKMGSWSGYNGTSCQDPRHGGTYVKNLGGALGDNMLHVAFTHDSMDDLNDMRDKMLARVLMRPVEVDGEMVLVPIKSYGNNETRALLNSALDSLNEVLVYGHSIKKQTDGDDMKTIYNSVDNSFEMCVTVQENVYGDDSIEVDCMCPACGGDGEISRDINDREVTFRCPLCSGSGEYTTTIEIEYDEYVDVEIEEEVYAYHDGVEGYDFNEYDGSYDFTINVSQVRRDIAEFIK